MKNKYYLANKREARVERINSFLVEKSLSMTLSIPKVLFKLVIKNLKKLSSRRDNLNFKRNPIYNHLEVPDSCFKSSSNIVRVL